MLIIILGLDSDPDLSNSFITFAFVKCYSSFEESYKVIPFSCCSNYPFSTFYMILFFFLKLLKNWVTSWNYEKDVIDKPSSSENTSFDTEFVSDFICSLTIPVKAFRFIAWVSYDISMLF